MTLLGPLFFGLRASLYLHNIATFSLVDKIKVHSTYLSGKEDFYGVLVLSSISKASPVKQYKSVQLVQAEKAPKSTQDPSQSKSSKPIAFGLY